MTEENPLEQEARALEAEAEEHEQDAVFELDNPVPSYDAADTATRLRTMAARLRGGNPVRSIGRA